ncbi:hypothetical protein GN244_ATG11039 [Phytophthora infestans]|uniref:Uncharacterized protein n=1 Tax=Phytophthora infestans TaxID=4787 RepID=A0A833T0U6_PHYIN|nr:hypothetical protein GN244_ATG11039 [Phytophthora infestans]KAF4128334.1 hypothetical protein GN958_ATG22412 [Phytophthora infestans]
MTQQLLEDFGAICSSDSVFCLYTGLIERLETTNEALTASDVSKSSNLTALDLELAIVDVLRLLIDATMLERSHRSISAVYDSPCAPRARGSTTTGQIRARTARSSRRISVEL